jgi:hypothetical protein
MSSTAAGETILQNITKMTAVLRFEMCSSFCFENFYKNSKQIMNPKKSLFKKLKYLNFSKFKIITKITSNFLNFHFQFFTHFLIFLSLKFTVKIYRLIIEYDNTFTQNIFFFNNLSFEDFFLYQKTTPRKNRVKLR